MRKLKNLLSTLWHHLDLVGVIIVGLISLVVMVVGAIEPAGEAIPAWLNLPNLTVVLLSAVAIYLVRERRQYFEEGQQRLEHGQDQLLKRQGELEQLVQALGQEMGGSAERIIAAIGAAEITPFKDESACIDYASRRIRDLTITSIDDCSWSRSQRIGADMDVYVQVAERHRAAIRYALKNNHLLVYREIFLFNTERKLEKLKEHEQANDQGYRCSYYKDEPNVPLLQFMIINKEEVIFMTDPYAPFFAIRNRLVADLFGAYYEDHWRKATPIKPGRSFPEGLVDQIAAECRRKWAGGKHVQRK